VKGLSLAVRFGCELAALFAVGWWGWTVTPVLGIALPIVVASVWGAWIAPRARRRLPDPARLALELVIFAAATACFVAVGQPVVAVVFAVAAGVTALPYRESDLSQTGV
jgi:MFS-type transporter involved in bile tolerance (Atg22 family)